MASSPRYRLAAAALVAASVLGLVAIHRATTVSARTVGASPRPRRPFRGPALLALRCPPLTRAAQRDRWPRGRGCGRATERARRISGGTSQRRRCRRPDGVLCARSRAQSSALCTLPRGAQPKNGVLTCAVLRKLAGIRAGAVRAVPAGTAGGVCLAAAGRPRQLAAAHPGLRGAGAAARWC